MAPETLGIQAPGPEPSGRFNEAGARWPRKRCGRTPCGAA